jgi:hypothetical protein
MTYEPTSDDAMLLRSSVDAPELDPEIRSQITPPNSVAIRYGDHLEDVGDCAMVIFILDAKSRFTMGDDSYLMRSLTFSFLLTFTKCVAFLLSLAWFDQNSTVRMIYYNTFKCALLFILIFPI